jgi:hypothetical protein
MESISNYGNIYFFSQTKTAEDIKIPSTFERAHLCDCMTLSKEISGANWRWQNQAIQAFDCSWCMILAYLVHDD